MKIGDLGELRISDSESKVLSTVSGGRGWLGLVTRVGENCVDLEFVVLSLGSLVSFVVYEKSGGIPESFMGLGEVLYTGTISRVCCGTVSKTRRADDTSLS